MSEELTDEQRLLVEAWEGRNELYTQLFGEYSKTSPKKYMPPLSEASNELDESQDTSDPGDEGQKLAVLTYAPDPLRPYWMYITSGLSNPWFHEEPEQVSGFGLELMIKTPEEAEWPLQVLRALSFHVFNYTDTFSPGVRINLNAPITASIKKQSDLDKLIIWYADEAPDAWYELSSGGFGIFLVQGITDDENDFAASIEEYGTWCIQEALRRAGIGQISDPYRKSVMQKEGIDEILESVRSYAENFDGLGSRNSTSP